MVTENQLKGYIFEEVLAFLIRSTGYTLIEDSSQDSDNLTGKGAFLKVKGRGGKHQVDVLGQLNWTPAFTYPLRLFIEAKFQSKAISIGIIRNAIAILSDINQSMHIDLTNKEIKPQYRYNYALFSCSGYSPDAINMALAHQIALFDLSGEDFSSLRLVIDDSAKLLVDTSILKGWKLKTVVRGLLRDLLRDTSYSYLYLSEISIEKIREQKEAIEEILRPIVNTTREYSELYVGMLNGPFIIILKANNNEDFLEYSKSTPHHDVSIHYDRNQSEGEKWTIQPVDNHTKYKLSFTLPKPLFDWIFQTSGVELSNRALDAKERYMSTISIYHYEDNREYLFRLKFDKEQTLNYLR